MTAISRTLSVLGTALAGAFTLAACTPGEPQPVPTIVVTNTAAQQAVFDPNGDAAANKAWFDQTNSTYISSNPDATPEDLVQNLLAAGFPAGSIEVTTNESPTGLEIKAIEITVLMGGSCLIGQLTDPVGYNSYVAPVLATGRCMIGGAQLQG